MKSQDASIRHMGVMAQDFRAAFKLGESELGINTLDADGVALAAIQGLDAKVGTELTARDAQIAALTPELAQERTARQAQARELVELKRSVVALLARRMEGAVEDADRVAARAP